VIQLQPADGLVHWRFRRRSAACRVRRITDGATPERSRFRYRFHRLFSFLLIIDFSFCIQSLFVLHASTITYLNSNT
jgi:hypothetical protein